MSNKETLARKEQELLDQIELLRKERELLAKLAEIRSEKESDKQVTNGRAPKSSQPSLFSPIGTGIKKAEYSWEKYTLVIIDRLKKPKSNDIKEYVRKANPEISEETIERTVTNSLWTLKKKGELSFIALGSRKDGYEYFLTDEQKKAAGL